VATSFQLVEEVSGLLYKGWETEAPAENKLRYLGRSFVLPKAYT
jgi:hypothetical protein